MADQHSDDGVGKTNAAIESLDSKGVTDQPSDEHVSTTNVSVGSSESQAVANRDANVGVSIADVAPENLKTKDAADKHLDEGLSTDPVAVSSSESSGVADQHLDESVSVADVALQSLKSKDVADKIIDEGAITDHVAGTSAKSTSVTDQYLDESVSVADVALESLKSKDVADKKIDEGAITDHVAGTSDKSTSVTDEHLDQSVSVADLALESLKLKDVTDKIIDEGAITDHVAGTSAKSTSVTHEDLDESVSAADVALESLKSKDVADKSIDEGAITDHVAGTSAKSASVTDQHLDESVSVADVALESLKSKDAADKKIDEGAVTDHKKIDEGAVMDHVAGTSAKSTSVTDQHSGEGVSVADVKGAADKSIGEGAITNHVADTSATSTSVTDQHSDEGLSVADVALDSLKSEGVADKHLDEGAVTNHVKSSQLTDVATQHSDEGVSIAEVSQESLKPKSVADKHIDEGETKTNVNTDGSTLEINVKTLDSKLHNFEVDKNMLVSLFKEKIASKVDLPVEKQRLIFRGKVLKDEDHLSEYHIESGHTLHLVVRQPSEFQNSAGSPNADATARSINTGQDANVTGTHPFVGHHSVVLGTIGAGAQDETNNPDIGQVIGAVLNSFGIAAQAPMGAIGATQPNMQFSIPVQVAHGSATGASLDNHGQTRDQSQPMPQATPAPVPTRAMPIPDSLYTISEYMNRMERALSPNGYQPSNSTEGVPAPAELPTNARGLLSPAALAVVLRHAQRLLIGPTIDSLSHTARRMEEEVGCTDVNVRTEIHTQAMQSGLAMQHLGALLLELGRTMLTLRIGQSHVESSVNAGPAVYISSSGPNPIMTQPFPLQTNSLFGDHHATPTMNLMGVGAVPRHLNIHIHAGVGPRATNVESNQGELANRNVGVNSQSREVGDNTISGNQAFSGLPEVRTDAGGMGNATSSTTRMKSLSEADGGSSLSRRSNAPIPVGLGSEGLQPQRRPRQTRSEACGSGTSNSYGNQSLTYPGCQMDPATMMNQVMQNPALSGLIAGASNQSGAGSQDVLRNLMSQLAQNPAMMNTVNQLAQQMDGNQDLASMIAAMGGSGDGSGNMSSMVQQMMPFVSQALNRGSSSSNLLQRQPSRKPILHRRHSSVKNLNINERSSSDFRMNLENAAQKIVEQYPPIEIFSSIVEAAALHNNVFDSGTLDELCMEEELAQEFVEMLKHDISRRLHGRR